MERSFMIRENILTLQRRLFGRCECCGKRLGAARPRVFGGYAWNGWLRSEGGLWHLKCLDEHPLFARASNVVAMVAR